MKSAHWGLEGATLGGLRCAGGIVGLWWHKQWVTALTGPRRVACVTPWRGGPHGHSSPAAKISSKMVQFACCALLVCDAVCAMVSGVHDCRGHPPLDLTLAVERSALGALNCCPPGQRPAEYLRPSREDGRLGDGTAGE